jgi:hypothetical protein
LLETKEGQEGQEGQEISAIPQTKCAAVQRRKGGYWGLGALGSCINFLFLSR